MLGEMVDDLAVQSESMCIGGRGDHPCDVPDEAGQFAGDHHHQRHAVRLAARGELAKEFAQRQLRIPGAFDDESGDSVVALADARADFRGSASGPGQQLTGEAVAALGDGTLALTDAGAVFARYQTQPGHQLSGCLLSRELTNLACRPTATVNWTPGMVCSA